MELRGKIVVPTKLGLPKFPELGALWTPLCVGAVVLAVALFTDLSEVEWLALAVLPLVFVVIQNFDSIASVKISKSEIEIIRRELKAEVDKAKALALLSARLAVEISSIPKGMMDGGRLDQNDKLYKIAIDGLKENNLSNAEIDLAFSNALPSMQKRIYTTIADEEGDNSVVLAGLALWARGDTGLSRHVNPEILKNGLTKSLVDPAIVDKVVARYRSWYERADRVSFFVEKASLALTPDENS